SNATSANSNTSGPTRKPSLSVNSSTTASASPKKAPSTTTSNHVKSTSATSKTKTPSSTVASKSVAKSHSPKTNGVTSGEKVTSPTDVNFKEKNEELQRLLEEKENILKSRQEELEALKSKLEKDNDSTSESVEQQVHNIEELKKAHEEETLRVQIEKDEAILAKDAIIEDLKIKIRSLEEEFKYEDKIVQLQKEHDTKNEEINEARVKEISEFTQKIKDNEIVIQELSTLKVEIENLKKSHQEQLVFEKT
ncbi:6284_t:CDS:2, partial [Entrophospora sp. SA101]